MSVDNQTMLICVDHPGGGNAGEGEVRREMQKIVAAHRYYGSKRAFQHMVMIEASDPKATKEKLHSFVRGKYATASVRSVWIAKVLKYWQLPFFESPGRK